MSYEIYIKQEEPIQFWGLKVNGICMGMNASSPLLIKYKLLEILSDEIEKECKI